MRTTMWRVLSATLVLLTASLFAMSAMATPTVTVNKVKVNGKEVDSGSIWVADTDEISIQYHVALNDSSSDSEDTEDTDTEVDLDHYVVYAEGDSNDTIAQTDDNALNGDTSVTVTTPSFTARRYNPNETSTRYDFKVYFVLTYSTTACTSYSSTGTGVCVTKTTTDSTVTKTVTVHMDMDPPGRVVLEPNPVAGEKSLKVSFDKSYFETSEAGNTESDLSMIFCIKQVSAATNLVVADTPVGGDVDDETAETASSDPADGDSDAAVDGDADLVDGDADTYENDVIDVDTDKPDADSSPATERTTDPDTSDCTMVETSGDASSPHTLTGLTNDVTYEVRAKAKDKAGNYSREWSEPITGTPVPVDDFWEAYKKAGGKEDGGFCFIATATYGSYSAHEVELLRVFRDRILANLPFGHDLIEMYYRVSPPLADAIRDVGLAKHVVSSLLTPFVVLMSAAFEFGLGIQLAAMTLSLLGLILFFRRPRRAREEVRA